MNLASHLERQAAERGDAPALVQRLGGRDRVESFAGLAARIASGGWRLDELGFRTGDVILVFHPVSIDLYGFLLACFARGVVAVLADPSGGAGFLSQVCEKVRPKGFFGSRKAHLLRLRVSALGRIPVALHPTGWWPGSSVVWSDRRAIANAGVVDVADGHPAMITFTSGSTGRPKGVVRSHGFLLDQHRQLERTLALTPGERDLVTLPVFALANLASGVTSVLADADLGRPGEADGAKIRRQCEDWRVTRITAAPAFLEALLRSDGVPAFDKVFTGGAPVFHDLVDRLKAARPGMNVTAVYGSTEAEPVAEFCDTEWTPDVLRVIAGGGGLPAGHPCCEVAVLGDDFGKPLSVMSSGEFEARRAERGEIVVAGSQVLSGYLDGEGDEETKVKVGSKIWHRTGDAGWFDREGRLWLLGRCSARIHGGRLYPLAVEAAMKSRFPGLRMAAVEFNGQALLIVEGTMPDGLEDAAADLGIEGVTTIDRLPMDRRHQSKIDYPALRGELEKGR